MATVVAQRHCTVPRRRNRPFRLARRTGSRADVASTTAPAARRYQPLALGGDDAAHRRMPGWAPATRAVTSVAVTSTMTASTGNPNAWRNCTAAPGRAAGRTRGAVGGQAPVPWTTAGIVAVCSTVIVPRGHGAPDQQNDQRGESRIKPSGS